MKGDRFTAYLSNEERTALRELANDLGTSENYMVRIALRSMLFGKPIPAYIQEAARSNTSNTSNAKKNPTTTSEVHA